MSFVGPTLIISFPATAPRSTIAPVLTALSTSFMAKDEKASYEAASSSSSTHTSQHASNDDADAEETEEAEEAEETGEAEEAEEADKEGGAEEAGVRPWDRAGDQT